MTREQVLKKVYKLMSSPSVRIWAEGETVRVYKITIAGDVLALVLYEEKAILDGIEYDIRKGDN